MRTIIVIIFLVLLPINFYGQEFSFTLRFEDAIGNKDSLTLGYDSNATDEVDTLFSEKNLHYTPFDPEFEVRITDDYRFHYREDTILLKKQIEKKKYPDDSYPLIQMILIKCVHFPIKVTWDPIFENEHVNKTILVDWYPGGWFDAASGGEQGPFFLKDSASINLPYLNKYSFEEIDYRGDSLKALYFMLASKENYKKIVGIQEIQTSPVVVYPNPVDDLLHINIGDKGDDIESVIVRDITGQIVISSHDNTSVINISSIPKGIYIIEVKLKHSMKPVISKVLKK